MFWKSVTIPNVLVLCISMVLGAPARGWKHSGDGKSLALSVDQHRVLFEYDGHVEVTCTVKSGTKTSETPFISFSWLLNKDTSMPLSSNEFGLTIDVVPYEADLKPVPDVTYRSETIVLTEQFYRYLRPGDNVFVCKTYNLNGQRVRDHFIIHKV